jgi:uncharacterized protein with PIN domain
VLRRFDLARRAAPFTRCLRCNAPLAPVAKADVADRLPPRIAGSAEEFWTCTGCHQVYWRGSHYARLRAAVDMLLDAGRQPDDARR